MTMGTLTQEDCELLRALRQLKLTGMANAVENQLENENLYCNEGFTARLMEAARAQIEYARERTYENMLRKARLPFDTTLESFGRLEDRGVSPGQLRALAEMRWVRKHVNIIIVGHTGTGKSSLASGIGENAVRNGYRTAYYQTHELLDAMLALGEDHKAYKRAMKALSKVQVLILDDFLNAEVTRPRVDMLYNLLTQRSGTYPTIVCTQVRPDGFSGILKSQFAKDPNPPMASIDSIEDRIRNPSCVIELKGPSLRGLEDSSLS